MKWLNCNFIKNSDLISYQSNIWILLKNLMLEVCLMIYVKISFFMLKGSWQWCVWYRQMPVIFNFYVASLGLGGDQTPSWHKRLGLPGWLLGCWWDVQVLVASGCLRLGGLIGSSIVCAAQGSLCSLDVWVLVSRFQRRNFQSIDSNYNSCLLSVIAEPLGLPSCFSALHASSF